MSDLSKLGVWGDLAIRGALSWYLDVAENGRPAKFRIAATVATRLDPAASSEDALWAELDRLTPIFVASWRAIRAGARLPKASEGPSLLELCRELAYRMLAHCNFCPWDCRVDRVKGTKLGAIRTRLLEASSLPLKEIAAEEGISSSYVTRLLRLAFLALDIFTAILNGRQSPQLTANRLMDDTRLPLDWTAQRELLRS